MSSTLKILPDGALPSIEEVHGGPALVVRAQGQIIFLLMCHIEDGQFATLYGITSPDKLTALN